MWVCLNDSFLSIVADRGNKNRLLVRARVAGHIEAVFPDADVFTDQGADYFYRAFIPREEVQDAMLTCIDRITYTNFKGSVTDRALHDAYMGFWQIMYKLQEVKLATKKVAKVFRKAVPSFERKAKVG